MNTTRNPYPHNCSKANTLLFGNYGLPENIPFAILYLQFGLRGLAGWFNGLAKEFNKRVIVTIINP